MKDHEFYLTRTIELADRAVKHGNTPFGALLVDHDGNVILEQENIEITENDCTGHAETTLMRKASKLYNKDFLWNCTLYTSVEP
jgi:tRNA(Arg) A34 adenosine deaminase TadA